MITPDRQLWSKLVFDKLVEADVSLFSYIPDFGNTDIIKMAEEHNKTQAVLLTKRKVSRFVLEPTLLENEAWSACNRQG